jgi:hypothetical protein
MAVRLIRAYGNDWRCDACPFRQVYTNPGPNGYATRVDHKEDEDVPLVINGVIVGRIAVADVLPA